MNTFRWFILRLFWTLLAVPLITFMVLWLANEWFLPDTSLSGGLVATAALLTIFPIVSTILTRVGMQRFEFLRASGKSYLKAEAPEQVRTSFDLILQLFDSGLLSNKLQRELQHAWLRSYFPFYAENPENPEYRHHLLEAMHQGIRADEAYHVLKAYVLNREALTLESAELAEELLDHKRDDRALANYFVQHFLEQKRKHYRAEYFYMRHLANDGPLVNQILQLCLEDVLARGRKDDFAVWCLVRAFQREPGERWEIRQQIGKRYGESRLQQRDDTLASALAACAEQLEPAEITALRAEQQVPRRRPLKVHWQRAAFALREKLWSWLTPLRPHWHKIVAGVAVMAIGFLIFLILPAPAPEEVSTPVEVPVVEDNRQYYSLQVGAVKQQQSAEQAMQELQARGLHTYLLIPPRAGGWFRIRLGKYESMDAAKMAADSLRAVGIIQDYFVTNYEEEKQ